MTKTNLAILERADMKMLRWMCKVKWEDRVSNDEILGRVGLEKLEYVLRRNRLRWFGHVERSEPENLLRSVEKVGNDDTRPKGRPKMTWLKTVEKDLVAAGLGREMCQSRDEWRRGIKLSNPERENGH